MKTAIRFFLLLFFLAGSARVFSQNTSGQDSTGLPGDNFSLQGALQMFQKARSPEEFEKLLNSRDNHVNNLDLNGDGNIDYIRVIDKMENGNHVFILRVPVSESESQDIAVIELEKKGNTQAVLQIVGDEDIYGQQTIVEPDGGVNNNAVEAGHGPYVNYDEPADAPYGIIVNVWFWPCVQFVYAPAYVVWESPFYWHRYPGWWSPWRPFAWHVWHPFYRYHPGFVVTHTYRTFTAHRIYAPVRVTSVTVHTRHATVVNHYRTTRTSTTTVRRGNENRRMRPNHARGRRHR